MIAKEEEINREKLNVERVLPADEDGRVFHILVDEGISVTPEKLLMRIEQAGQTLQALVYVPSRAGQKVREGDPAEVCPSNISRDDFGGIVATVTRRAVIRPPGPAS